MVDRREALKKLGVGGGVALGAPLLLDGFINRASASGEFACDQAPQIQTGHTQLSLNGRSATITVLDSLAVGTNTFSWMFGSNTGNDVTSGFGSGRSVTVELAEGFDQGDGTLNFVPSTLADCTYRYYHITFWFNIWGGGSISSVGGPYNQPSA